MLWIFCLTAQQELRPPGVSLLLIYRDAKGSPWEHANIRLDSRKKFGYDTFKEQKEFSNVRDEEKKNRSCE